MVSPPPPPPPTLTILPLVALIFYDVSGGPFGIEDAVGSGGGTLLPLLAFLLLPLLWSLPEALLTAELAAAIPSNGGYVRWVTAAFGPFWGFQVGLWKWASGNFDNALYPVLFLDYLAAPSGVGRSVATILITAALTYLNYRGLHVVGVSAILLTLFSLAPFLALAVLSIPRIQPSRWFVLNSNAIKWRGFFNTMFWNLNYWDKASTLAGEVEDPSRTFPKAVIGAVGLVMAAYLVPLLAGTGALPTETMTQWTAGYFSEVGRVVGGPWLRAWIQLASGLSNMGLFEAEMSSDSFQLLGMAEMGMLPSFFAWRSKYGTPTLSILCSATGVVFLSWMTFQEIIEFLNFLYALGMLLEFAAFIKLRICEPDLARPYKIPGGTVGAVMICIPPTILLLIVMCLASARTVRVSLLVIIIGAVLYFAIEYMKRKKWVHFISTTCESPHSCDGTLASNHSPSIEEHVSLLADGLPANKIHDTESSSIIEVPKSD